MAFCGLRSAANSSWLIALFEITRCDQVEALLKLLFCVQQIGLHFEPVGDVGLRRRPRGHIALFDEGVAPVGVAEVGVGARAGEKDVLGLFGEIALVPPRRELFGEMEIASVGRGRHVFGIDTEKVEWGPCGGG